MTLNYLASNYEESKIIKIKVFKGPETKKVEQTKDLLKKLPIIPQVWLTFPFEALASAVGGWDPDHLAEAQLCDLLRKGRFFDARNITPIPDNSQKIKPY